MTRRTHRLSLKRKPFVKTKNPLHDILHTPNCHILKTQTFLLKPKTLWMTSHNSDFLKRNPCQTKKKKPLLHDIPQLRIAPNSAKHAENANLILLSQESPLHDIPQPQIAPNSARHIFKTKTFFKKQPMTFHTLLHHETLKQKQILCKKSTLSNGFVPGTLRVMSRTQQTQISTQWDFDRHTIEYRGFSTRPDRVAVQSDISLNPLCIFSLTLTPSETECLAHIYFLCWMYLFPRWFGRAV